MSQDRKTNYRRFNHLYKLYCPNKELRFICYFCGLPADTVDHVPPLNCVLDLRKDGLELNYIKVPACKSCNQLGSDEPHTNLQDRQDFIKSKIRKKFGRFLRSPDWEDDEIEELGFRLKQSVIALMEIKYLVAYRLEYGTGNKYLISDLGYLEMDPRKILKYAKPKNWDKAMAAIDTDTITLEQATKALSRGGYKNNSRTQTYYSFAEAKQALLKIKLKSSSEYTEWRKQNIGVTLRDKLPSNPRSIYGDLWKSWEDYLGPTYDNLNKAIKARAAQNASYQEAKKLVQEYGVKNASHYGKVRKENLELQEKTPSNPVKIYSEEWVSWQEFLGDNYRNKNLEIKTHINSYVDYECAKNLVINYGITNSTSYMQYRKDDPKARAKLPPNPKIHYEEWISWESFIGDNYRNKNNELINQRKFILNYNLAQKLVNKLGVSNSGKYSELLRRNPNYKRRLPSWPPDFYGDQWKGWKHFLGENYGKK